MEIKLTNVQLKKVEILKSGSICVVQAMGIIFGFKMNYLSS